MLKVGLTGGIGSGKTTVSDRFADLGAPVIDTDVLAREVVEPGEPALEQLVDDFGGEILRDDGTLNRDGLRERIFNDPEAKRRVESILHPAIRQRLNGLVKELARQDIPYCIIVVPLLVETDFRELVDRILVVEAPRERRIRWVMERNGLSREEVEKIMDTQSSTEERRRVAHDIIENTGSRDDLLEKVDRLHAKYLVVPPRVK
jgi:dephospho-CoA kinase